MKYRICNRCIMDTTDREIEFDENGICNHCKSAQKKLQERNFYLDKEVKKKLLEQKINEIKEKGKAKKYDCVIGVSGGVDSTFVAYKVKKLGLRPFAFHLDNGWNSEIAEKNIKNISSKLGIKIHRYLVNWEEFKDLQMSFLKASVPDLEIPTDHAITALSFKSAYDKKINYIITGTNINTESILPPTWANGHMDWKYIRNIHNRFGKEKLNNYYYYSIFDYARYRIIKNIKKIPILNYINYDKEEAKKIIKKKLDWEDYGAKHHESVYTRFIQAYILPKKFNIDKRRAHLSSLICSDQITRKEALKEMKKDIYPPEKLKEDKQFVLKKLQISEKEFDKLMSLPPKCFLDYPSYVRSMPTPIISLIEHVYKYLNKNK